MNQPIHDRTEMALCALIQNSLESQILARDQRQYDPLSYLKKFCQVRLTGPRMSGHTTAAFKVCGAIFNNPLHVATTHDLSKAHKDMAQRRGLDIDNFAFTSRRSFPNACHGGPYDAIVVDPAYDMTPAFYGELFGVGNVLAARHDEFCIILMG